MGSGRTLVDQLYQEIMPRLSVEDVYSDVKFASRRGRWWRAPCPLHQGQDPNFHVNTETLVYNCFSHCGSGSALAYLNGGEAPRGQRFVELCRELAAKAGVEIEEQNLTAEQRAELERRRRRQEALESYADACAHLLRSGNAQSVRDYLSRRGFPSDGDALAAFGLGMGPNTTDLPMLTGMSLNDLDEFGLTDGRWAGRLVITLRDRWRQIASFGAREVAGAVGPKYLYLRGAPRPPFMGLARFTRGRPPEFAIIVEGLLDVPLLESHGLSGVLAIGSARVSERHFQALGATEVHHVVLALDDDAAGYAGTDAFVEAARSLAPDLRVDVVPVSHYLGHKDPGELVAAAGSAAMLSALKSRIPAAIWSAEAILGSLSPRSPAAERQDALTDLANLVSRLTGPNRGADAEDTARVAQQRLGYSAHTVATRFGIQDLPVGSGEPEPPRAMTRDANRTRASEPPGEQYSGKSPRHATRGRLFPPDGVAMYEAQISRVNPTALLFLIDQSASMSSGYAGSANETKADFLATLINRQLHELIIRCTKDDGIRGFFDVAVIGYGGGVTSALNGAPVEFLVSISDLGEAPLRVEERARKVPDGVGSLVDQTVRFPVWVDPVANGATPMCEALRTAQDLLAEWIETHPDSFPPCIINVTDGAATDGDPTEPAADLATLASRDGNVILLNVHISSVHSDPIEYPVTNAGLPDDLSKRLFQMSSELPSHLLDEAVRRGHALQPGARGFAYNADPIALTEFLVIGTTTPAPREIG